MFPTLFLAFFLGRAALARARDAAAFNKEARIASREAAETILDSQTSSEASRNQQPPLPLVRLPSFFFPRLLFC